MYTTKKCWTPSRLLVDVRKSDSRKGNVSILSIAIVLTINLNEKLLVLSSVFSRIYLVKKVILFRVDTVPQFKVNLPSRQAAFRD